MNRATSPFMVKTATQVQQIPNDPAVKSLVKSVVMFNDVEYQVPTKVRSCIKYTCTYVINSPDKCRLREKKFEHFHKILIFTLTLVSFVDPYCDYHL